MDDVEIEIDTSNHNDKSIKWSDKHVKSEFQIPTKPRNRRV